MAKRTKHLPSCNPRRFDDPSRACSCGADATPTLPARCCRFCQYVGPCHTCPGCVAPTEPTPARGREFVCWPCRYIGKYGTCPHCKQYAVRFYRSGTFKDSRVYTADGKSRKVKNLGWILRNHKHVFKVRVEPYIGGGDSGECVVTFVLNTKPGAPGGAVRYVSNFGSARILWDWLRRPVFGGLPLQWGEIATEVGSSVPYPGVPTAPPRYWCPEYEFTPIGGERFIGWYAEWADYLRDVDAQSESQVLQARAAWQFAMRHHPGRDGRRNFA